nr:MAG TPA: hypothetical protein [Caudoviricetes sp.]
MYEIVPTGTPGALFLCLKKGVNTCEHQTTEVL